LLRRALWLSLPLTAVVAGGYTAVVLATGPRHLAVWLAFAPTLLLSPFTAVYAAFLTADRRYALTMLRVPLITAVVLVALSLLLPFWRSITALAIAVNVGHLSVLGFLVVRARRGRPAVPGRPAERLPVSALAQGAASVFVATLLTGQLVVLAERALAATLAAGAVTLLVNARGFVLLPAIVAQALASGVFPAATERFKVLGGRGLADLAAVAIRFVLVTATVAAVYIVVCRRELIEITLLHGNFDPHDAAGTARLVAVMGPAVVGISAAAVAAKALYGVGRQRFVAVASGLSIAVYGAAALALREIWEVEGLAAAFVLSAAVGGLLLVGGLARAVELSPRTVAREWVVAPVGLAASFGAAAWSAWVLTERILGEGSLPALGVALASGLAGVTAFAAAAVLTDAREIRLLRSGLGTLRRAHDRPGHRSAEAPG
jgi:peptidoglycan biosynthesis protein MviN/MurJ (putative lipid II flippase)